MFNIDDLNRRNEIKEQLFSIKEDNKIHRNSQVEKLSLFEKLEKKGFCKLLKDKLSSLFIKTERDKAKYQKKYPILPSATNNRNNIDYFFNEKIVVYTCITGKYDLLLEPKFIPDNVDYYVITSNDISKNSVWKKIDISTIKEVEGLNDHLKARYIKLHPHILFKNYNYSVYVDGNFQINTDFTEHVNRISKIGFSVFRHCQRRCVYEEIKACKLLHKAKEEDLNRYLNRLKENSMPVNYGLVETGMIVRMHNNENCIRIMNDWWNEISTYIHRDQITLPFVLYKNSITVDSIATLGNNIREDYSFEIVSHIKK